MTGPTFPIRRSNTGLSDYELDMLPTLDEGDVEGAEQPHPWDFDPLHGGDERKEAVSAYTAPVEDMINTVSSTSEETTRLISGIFVAAIAAFIASYGLIATFAVLGLGFVATPLISSQARAEAADPNSTLSLQEKVELIAKAKLWEDTVLTGICFGSGIGSVYQGITTIFQDTVISVLKGSCSVVVGVFAGMTGVVSLDRYNTYLTQEVVEANWDLCQLLEEKQAPQQTGAFILGLQSKQKENFHEKKREIQNFLLANPTISILNLAHYFSSPFLLNHFGNALCSLLDTFTNISPDEILEQMPEELFQLYIGGFQGPPQEIDLEDFEAASPERDVGIESVPESGLDKLIDRVDGFGNGIAKFQAEVGINDFSKRFDRFRDSKYLDGKTAQYTFNFNALNSARSRFEALKAWRLSQEQTAANALEQQNNPGSNFSDLD